MACKKGMMKRLLFLVLQPNEVNLPWVLSRESTVNLRLEIQGGALAPHAQRQLVLFGQRIYCTTTTRFSHQGYTTDNHYELSTQRLISASFVATHWQRPPGLLTLMRGRSKTSPSSKLCRILRRFASRPGCATFLFIFSRRSVKSATRLPFSLVKGIAGKLSSVRCGTYSLLAATKLPFGSMQPQGL